MRGLEHYQTVAAEMVAADASRDEMLRAMDAMWQNQWNLPESVRGLRWIHKVVSTDPHDAIRAGTRVLSSVAPRITLQPLGPSAESRAAADKIERALSWHFRNASRRRRASVLRDVVLSALLYDEVVAQVVYLPEQIAAIKAFKGETQRLEAARRFGPFAILVRNPQQVHVRYSDWMPEAVLLKRVAPVQEALDFWGSKARKLSETVSKRSKSKGARGKTPELKYCTIYDYMDLEERAVWAIPQESGGTATGPLGEADGAEGVEILREGHGLGFLPWAAKVGGSTLEEASGRQRTPLLHSVWTAGQWETQNIVETLMTSEVIAYAAAPRLKIEGPSDSVEVDYGEPGRPAYVPPGHALSPLAPPGLDQSLALIAQQVGERIGKSTVPRILQTGDFPAGTGFATLNLATQSGIKALAPYKELAEQALAEVFTLMLNWVKQSGEPLMTYAMGSTKTGEQILVKPDEFDIDKLYVDVELTADVPADNVSKINAASMAVRELGYSRQRALEQIGETDPVEAMKQARLEQLEDLRLEIQKQRAMAAAKVETNFLVQSLQQSLGSEAPQTNVEEALAKDSRLLKLIEARVRNVRGQGFNPAQGGTPAVVADPEGEAVKSRQAKDGQGV